MLVPIRKLRHIVRTARELSRLNQGITRMTLTTKTAADYAAATTASWGYHNIAVVSVAAATEDDMNVVNVTISTDRDLTMHWTVWALDDGTLYGEC